MKSVVASLAFFYEPRRAHQFSVDFVFVHVSCSPTHGLASKVNYIQGPLFDFKVALKIPVTVLVQSLVEEAILNAARITGYVRSFLSRRREFSSREVKMGPKFCNERPFLAKGEIGFYGIR